MARVRSPNRDKAFEIYRESNGTITNREISNILDISEKTISGWKAKDKWNEKLNGVLQKEIRSTPKKKNTENKLKTSKGANCINSKKVKDKDIITTQKTNSTNLGGAPKGNKNALGNKGGNGGPAGNKKAVTTGEFERIFFDTLEDDELELVNNTPFEKIDLLKQEIQLLTVRERRMLKRIDDLKKSKEVVIDTETHGTQGDSEVSLVNYESTLNKIQNIEEALTRVQDKKQKAIDTLHKFEIDEHKLELSVMKLELEIMKQGRQDEEVEDDGFMEALKSEVGDTWDD